MNHKYGQVTKISLLPLTCANASQLYNLIMGNIVPWHNLNKQWSP